VSYRCTRIFDRVLLTGGSRSCLEGPSVRLGESFSLYRALSRPEQIRPAGKGRTLLYHYSCLYPWPSPAPRGLPLILLRELEAEAFRKQLLRSCLRECRRFELSCELVRD
jgi:hypothetical protein